MNQFDAPWRHRRYMVRDASWVRTNERIRNNDDARRMRAIGCRHADQCTHPRCQCPVVRVDELHTLRARTEVES